MQNTSVNLSWFGKDFSFDLQWWSRGSGIVWFSQDSEPICRPVPLWEWRMVTPGFIWWHIDHSLTRKDLSGCPFFIYLCEKIYPHYLFFLQFHVNLSLPSGIYKWRLRSLLPRLVVELLMQVLNKNLMAESIVGGYVILNPPPKQWQGQDLQSSKSLSSPPVITLACKRLLEGGHIRDGQLE